MTTAVMAGVCERAVRSGIPEGCLGAEIDQMATAEKSLTAGQLEVVEADFDGRPQIIRGVTGSGKTWVLANHLARRVARNSQRLPGLAGEYPRIGVVCFNRCLVPFIERRACEAYDKLPHGTKCNCGVAISCWRRSGEALTRYQWLPSLENAIEACVLWSSGCASLAARHTSHPQFHCGTPPPAAAPRTTMRSMIRLREILKHNPDTTKVDFGPHASFPSGHATRPKVHLC